MEATQDLPEIRALIDREDFETAARKLKNELCDCPYWSLGHRLLGDLYLTKLDSPVNALVEYRKLNRVKEELTPAEKLRLLVAYHLRSFDDRARRLLDDLSVDRLPQELEIIGEVIEPRRRISKIKSEVERNVEQNSSSYFKKYVRRGNEFLNAGSYFRAQKAYDRALEFDSSPRVRLNRARCLVKRTRYPEAVEELQALQSNEHVHEEARNLLRSVYERLGLPVTKINSETKPEG